MPEPAFAPWKILRPTEIPGLELLALSDVRGVVTNVTPMFRLVHLARGHGGFRYRRRDHACLPGSVAVVRGDEPFTAFVAPGTSGDIVQLSLEPALLARFGSDAPGTVRERGDGLGLRRGLLAVRQVLETGGEALALEEALVGLVAQVRGDDPAKGGRHPRVERARAYLQAHLEGPLSIGDLSREVGLSPAHLVRAFKAHFGLTPLAYAMHARVGRAAVMLRDGASATAAAHAWGFCDQSHLTRWFRKVLGMTPSAYATAGRAERVGPSSLIEDVPA